MKYCAKCGKKNDFAANFCCICANPFTNLSAISYSKQESLPPILPQKTQAIKKKNIYTPVFTEPPDIDDDDNDGDPDINFDLINNIRKLDVEVQNLETKALNVGSLMEGGSDKGAAQALKDSKKKHGKINKKAVVEQLMNEGKAIHPK